jgi:hypothetical protein
VRSLKPIIVITSWEGVVADDVADRRRRCTLLRGNDWQKGSMDDRCCLLLCAEDGFVHVPGIWQRLESNTIVAWRCWLL